MALSVGFWTYPEDRNRYDLVAVITLVVVLRGHDLPDDSVTVLPDADRETAFPLVVKVITEIWSLFQLVEESARSLDQPVRLGILTPEAPQIFLGLRRQRYFVSLCRGKVLPARAFFLALLSRSTSRGSSLISLVIRCPTAPGSGTG